MEKSFEFHGIALIIPLYPETQMTQLFIIGIVDDLLYQREICDDRLETFSYTQSRYRLHGLHRILLDQFLRDALLRTIIADLNKEDVYEEEVFEKL